MEIRNLRHRVQIQSLTATQDTTSGIVTETWALFATVWAEITPVSAREFAQAAALQSKITARIVIRYLAGVVPSMRVVCDGKTWNIEGVLPDPATGNEWLTLPASEVVLG